MEIGRLVAQKDEWGCGAACVASLLAISYVEALERLEHYKGTGINESPEGLEPAHITCVLKEAGYEIAKQYKANSWPLGTIVLLTWEFGRYKDSGHYMLLTGRGWMDPWFNLNKRPRKAKFRAKLPRNTAVKTALVVKCS